MKPQVVKLEKVGMQRVLGIICINNQELTWNSAGDKI